MASALSLFVKKGYEHTTFTDIAARLKLTKGAVYWHFDSKTALLMALINEMQEKFQRLMKETMPKGGLTFLAVADTMVACAERIVKDPKGAAFFMLMRTQIKWGSETMAHTREELLSKNTNGPYHTIIKAITNDIAAGKVRKDVNPVAIAAVSMAIWDGIVQSKICNFLECDLVQTIKRSYEAMWQSIAIKGK